MADYSAQFIDATPEYRVATSYTSSTPIIIPAINYAQRVWSTGTSVWCYYVGAINASPASTATTPNWVASAVNHQVLGPA